MKPDGQSPNTPSQEDDALIEACLRRDPAAWSRFVDRYGRLVYSVPARMGLPKDACDDIFQNVFTIILRELPAIRDHASLPKWLITVAHRESYRWLRTFREHTGSPAVPLAEQPAEANVLCLERQQIVHDGLEQLGGRCRDLLTALFLHPDRPTYQEISERLGISVGAIGPTRNRCLQKLLRVLAGRLE